MGKVVQAGFGKKHPESRIQAGAASGLAFPVPQEEEIRKVGYQAAERVYNQQLQDDSMAGSLLDADSLTGEQGLEALFEGMVPALKQQVEDKKISDKDVPKFIEGAGRRIAELLFQLRPEGRNVLNNSRGETGYEQLQVFKILEESVVEALRDRWGIESPLKGVTK